MKILKAYEDFEGPEGGNYKVSKVPANRKTHRFLLKNQAGEQIAKVYHVILQTNRYDI